MPRAPIVSARFYTKPLHEPGLFPGRPWTVYYNEALRADGKRDRRGIRSFETEVDAWTWLFEIDCATANAEPF